jgi:hypothetical protein
MSTHRTSIACLVALLAAAVPGCFPWMFGDEEDDELYAETDPDSDLLYWCSDLGYWPEDATIDEAADLDELYGCPYVQGSVSVEYSSDIFDLDELEWLVTIGGGLFVDGNSALTSLSGLDMLFMVDGSIAVDYNADLYTLDGLDALVATGGSLSIEGNPSLASLDGLGALLFVEGDVTIRDNPSLSTCAAEELVDRLIALGFDGTVTIEGNGDCDDEADDGI